MFLKISLLTLVLLSVLTPDTFAQNRKKSKNQLTPEGIAQLHASEDTLAYLAFVVVNDSVEQERFAACRSLITGLVRALKVENSFKYPFDRLKSLSILSPPDSSFRIFTWQMYVNDSTYRYYGAVQMNTPELKLYPLKDRSFEMEMPAPTEETLSPDAWYGALYYNLRQADTKQGRHYLLFGFDAYSFFDKRKLIDVLTFDATGKPVFGAAVFAKPDGSPDPHKRYFFDYSSEAAVRVNWDEEYKMILFDHLIAMPSPFGRGVTFVSDGSYDGFRWEKGRWQFVDKVFNDKMSEDQTQIEPVLGQRKGKNLMGGQERQPGKKQVKSAAPKD